MSKIVKNGIAACVLFVLFAILQFFCADALRGISAVLPEAVEVRLSDQSVIMSETGELSIASTISIGASISAYVQISEDASETPIALLYLTDSGGRHAQYLIQQASQYFLGPLDGEVHNYRDMLSLARAVRYLPILFCALFLSVLLLFASARQINTAFILQGEPPSRRVLRVCIAVLVTAGTLAGLSFLMEGLVVPGEYLPPNSIFDLNFYIERVNEFYDRMNQPGAVLLGRVFAERIKVLSIAGAVSILPFCAAAGVVFQVLFAKRRTAHSRFDSN